MAQVVDASAASKTRCRNFSKTTAATPSLPPTKRFKPADAIRHADYIPSVPAHQRPPRQEAGVRPSRALGYRLDVELSASEHRLEFTIANGGRLGAHLQARSNDVPGAPFTYTLGAGDTLRPHLSATGSFDVSFHGPNGFFRRFAGNTHDPLLEVKGRRDGSELVLTLHNRHAHAGQHSGPVRSTEAGVDGAEEGLRQKAVSRHGQHHISRLPRRAAGGLP